MYQNFTWTCCVEIFKIKLKFYDDSKIKAEKSIKLYAFGNDI